MISQIQGANSSIFHTFYHSLFSTKDSLQHFIHLSIVKTSSQQPFNGLIFVFEFHYMLKTLMKIMSFLFYFIPLFYINYCKLGSILIWVRLYLLKCQISWWFCRIFWNCLSLSKEKERKLPKSLRWELSFHFQIVHCLVYFMHMRYC